VEQAAAIYYKAKALNAVDRCARHQHLDLPMFTESPKISRSAIKLPVYNAKPNPRKEYRQQESQRIADSATLADTFRNLKSLTLDLTHFSPGSPTKNSEIKYTVNLTNAKARFRFSCRNEQCVGGDFDLSNALAKAVAAHQTTVTGEVICQGWRSNTVIDQVRCHQILRYKLTAEYGRASQPTEPEDAVASGV
jgi:hypothetical protein